MRNHYSLFSFLLIVMLGLAFASSGFTQDDVKFIPGEDSGFYYTIKKGDTLWDLSQKFYNSQWDWPGLWEMNDEIKNPHWIYPGKRIRIFLKDRAKLKPIVVPVKKVPQEPIKASFSFSEMDSIGFIKKERQPSLGHIIKEKDGHLLITNNDMIYIKPSAKGALIPGKTYQIFSVDEIKEKIGRNVFTGYRHVVKSQIKVISDKVSYVTALVTESYRAAEIGDMIMAYTPKEKVLTVNENPASISSRVICSQDDHLMINDYTIGFIDAGKSMVKPGQIYTVLRKNKLGQKSTWDRKKKEDIELEDLQSGKLIVLHTEDIASTVMILSSGYAIRPNDPVN